MRLRWRLYGPLAAIAAVAALQVAAPAQAVTVTEYQLPAGLGTGRGLSTAGPDGALWIGRQQGAIPKLIRWDPEARKSTVFDLGRSQGLVEGIATGSDGGVWLVVGDLPADSLGVEPPRQGGDLIRVDPATGDATVVRHFPPPPPLGQPGAPGPQPTGIAADDGHIWVLTNQEADPPPEGLERGGASSYTALNRLDLANGTWTRHPMRGCAAPRGLAIAADGTLWTVASANPLEWTRYSGEPRCETRGTFAPLSFSPVSQTFTPHLGAPFGNVPSPAPDGTLWAADVDGLSLSRQDKPALIDRLDAAGNLLRQLPIDAHMTSDLGGVLPTPDGSVWVSAADVLMRVDPETGAQTPVALPTAVNDLQGLATLVLDGHGTLWAVEHDRDVIAKIDPAGSGVDVAQRLSAVRQGLNTVVRCQQCSAQATATISPSPPRGAASASIARHRTITVARGRLGRGSLARALTLRFDARRRHLVRSHRRVRLTVTIRQRTRGHTVTVRRTVLLRGR